ncbi:MAG: methyltransferase domain-containing protein [Saprospiraceae bacterium]|nr:methyltransferase domain-containing protein [Saprospiraceae bacterium]MBK8485802.1 methyltransferase domain-containing protein [Saprospiraceae bacterium]MBK9222354.1 methyltransferase domain-containing protein [Saprospiraceae bacterium]MBK9723032.1 methyltransferase domain-containing protein [Saprospiraceae bacterium]MBK9726894.1 methyltransferase domain-containing protein [Saprospiraceae bacterium]
MILDYFKIPMLVNHNVLIDSSKKQDLEFNQQQTKETFDTKWKSANHFEDIEKLHKTQYEWFLKLYGFNDLETFRAFLKNKSFIIDTGCGLGYKSFWFSQLAPHAIVLGIDVSESCLLAAAHYKDIKNLYFLQSDIANTPLKAGVCDFVVCDQVIMHTENPTATFAHLSSLLSDKGEFACYFYRKKALPRELIDDYFRTNTHNIPDAEIWQLSEQLTELGKRLSALQISFESPEIPLLGIKAGTYDIQRFIYWNFLKCYWNPEWGYDLSKITNYDWYAPSNAKRFSEEEVKLLISQNNLKIIFWHEEEACYSGRYANLETSY